MIIDLSYFTGLINVPSLDKDAVAQQMNNFIVQYEPEYLQRILGYQLATDFMTGLQANPIDQMWLDLLIGQTYTATDGTTQKWNGFANTLAYPSIGSSDSSFSWIVGAPGSPVAGTTSFTDQRLINKQFFIERRGSGTMIQELPEDSNSTIADYSVTASLTNGSNDMIMLLQQGIKFQSGEVYIIHITGFVNAINNSSVNISPIAYYVYYRMVEDMNQQMTVLGTFTKPKSENADVIVPVYPMVKAWNKMVDLNRSLVSFLNANNSVYTGIPYYGYSCAYGQLSGLYNSSSNELLVKNNVFGI